MNDQSEDSSLGDGILEAIMSEGKEQAVDQTIKYLQLLYESRKPVALTRIGGPAGLHMSRIAFAIMIKFSDLLDNFQILVGAIEIQIELDDGIDQIFTVIK